jgi:hypothetical protein
VEGSSIDRFRDLLVDRFTQRIFEGMFNFINVNFSDLKRLERSEVRRILQRVDDRSLRKVCYDIFNELGAQVYMEPSEVAKVIFLITKEFLFHSLPALLWKTIKVVSRFFMILLILPVYNLLKTVFFGIGRFLRFYCFLFWDRLKMILDLFWGYLSFLCTAILKIPLFGPVVEVFLKEVKLLLSEVLSFCKESSLKGYKILNKLFSQSRQRLGRSLIRLGEIIEGE